MRASSSMRSRPTRTGPLTPPLELGVRHDAGGAKTGLGVNAGTALRVTREPTDPKASVRGHALLVLEDGALTEHGFPGTPAWNSQPATPRGPTLSVMLSLEAPATGDTHALLALHARNATADFETGIQATHRIIAPESMGTRSMVRTTPKRCPQRSPPREPGH